MQKIHEHTLRIPLRIFQLVPEAKRRLGLIVFIVAFIHFLLFFFLEIHYPTTHGSAVRRTEVFLSSPALMGVETWNSTVFWNQMRDPSTLLRQSLIPQESSKLIHPVFETISNSHLPLLPVGSEAEVQNEEQLPLDRKAFEKMVLVPKNFVFSVNSPNTNPSTQVLYSKNLESRMNKSVTVWPSVTVNLLNESRVTTIRIGISAEGAVLHTLIEESSGSNEVDQIALQEIRKKTFQPRAGQGIEWGSATIFWVFNSPLPKGKEGT